MRVSTTSFKLTQCPDSRLGLDWLAGLWPSFRVKRIVFKFFSESILSIKKHSSSYRAEKFWGRLIVPGRRGVDFWPWHWQWFCHKSSCEIPWIQFLKMGVFSENKPSDSFFSSNFYTITWFHVPGWQYSNVYCTERSHQYSTYCGWNIHHHFASSFHPVGAPSLCYPHPRKSHAPHLISPMESPASWNFSSW